MIELSEIRQMLDVAAASDHLLPSLRAEAIAEWEHRTGALWERRTDYVRVWRAEPQRMIYLPLVNTTSTITVAEKDEVGDAYVSLVEGEDYDYIPAQAISEASRVVRCGAWSPFVRITMTGGYLPADTPADIKRALAMQVGFLLQRWTGPRVIAENESQGDASTNFLKSAGGMGNLHLTATSHPAFIATAQRRQVFRP